MSDAVHRLRAFLKSQATGQIVDPQPVRELLADCWEQIRGSCETSMSKSKIYRVEQIEWHPPQLRFIVERHGGTANGSTRAELHQWALDIERLEAKCDEHYGYRQLHKRETAVDTNGLAEQIAGIILKRADDVRLKWSADRSRVRILVGQFISGRFKQTVNGRRRRFREALAAKLHAEGWQQVTSLANVYECRREKY